MLIFSYKLENYIRKKIFKDVLMVPTKYVIKGSFRRRIPYVTDIDVVNEVYPEINGSNIYEELKKLINRVLKNPQIILVYVTCGVDDRFRINTGSDKELADMRKLLSYDDAIKFDSVLEQYKDNFDKKLFFISEIIWKYYKLRWSPKNVLDNNMELVGGVNITFTNVLETSSSVLLQYYVKIDDYPVGIDVVIVYKPTNMKMAYQSAGEYQLKLSNYSKEYYYMLFPFRMYFRNNKKILDELENLIEKKMGLYKQLIVRIDVYETLYQTKNLTLVIAKQIVSSIVKDLYSLSNFRSNTVKKIKDVFLVSRDEDKLSKWNVLLQILYDEINQLANIIAKKYFFEYLQLVPENIRTKYYLNIRST